VVEKAVAVTPTAAVPPPDIVVVATGDPVPEILLYMRTVALGSPVRVKVGVTDTLLGLAGMDDTITGAAGATLSCV
jgi:hypothetical protein